jgi:hypothetical protein
VDQWANGTDAAAELTRMMDVRRAALSRFGERRSSGRAHGHDRGALVPLYLHHRYQVESAASAIGGLYYVYAMRGDGREPVRHVPAAEQRAALDALLRHARRRSWRCPAAAEEADPAAPVRLRHDARALPALHRRRVRRDHPGGGGGRHHGRRALLNGARAARVVQQHALDPSLPGLDQVIDQLVPGDVPGRDADEYEAEIARAVQRVVVENLMTLAANASMPQVRAIARYKLRGLGERQRGGPTPRR